MDRRNDGHSESRLEHLHQDHSESSEVDGDGLRQHDSEAAPPKNPRFLRLTVQNIGTAPTTLTNVEFFETIPRWKRLLSKLRPKMRAGEIHAILNDYRGPQIPHKLEVGSEWVGLMEQNKKFEDWLETDKLWCAIHHSFSRKAVSRKIIRGPI